MANQRKTTLVHKKGPANIAKNYRPITCLPTYYKLLTMIFTDQVYEHVIKYDILPLEQKGVRRKARGCKDQLLLDKVIMENAKKRSRNLSMMWIDYKKAYDSVPHSWIIECLKMYKLNENIVNFIEYTMTYWKTQVSIHHEGGTTTSEDIKFNTGIFQGDTLSPLIFCLALAPISHMLKRLGMGYRIAGTTVSNSLYIDDLKVFAADAKQMENCKTIIQEFSNDIGMSFGLEKCAVIHIKKGKVNNTPDTLEIPILDQEESYKYLGILESNSIQHTSAKAIARKEFFKRVRSILKAEINAKHTTGAIRTFAMPVL